MLFLVGLTLTAFMASVSIGVAGPSDYVLVIDGGRDFSVWLGDWRARAPWPIPARIARRRAAYGVVWRTFDQDSRVEESG